MVIFKCDGCGKEKDAIRDIKTGKFKVPKGWREIEFAHWVDERALLTLLHRCSEECEESGMRKLKKRNLAK